MTVDPWAGHRRQSLVHETHMPSEPDTFRCKRLSLLRPWPLGYIHSVRLVGLLLLMAALSLPDLSLHMCICQSVASNSKRPSQSLSCVRTFTFPPYVATCESSSRRVKRGRMSSDCRRAIKLKASSACRFGVSVRPVQAKCSEELTQLRVGTRQ